jgi:hypothetical protein
MEAKFTSRHVEVTSNVTYRRQMNVNIVSKQGYVESIHDARGIKAN